MKKALLSLAVIGTLFTASAEKVVFIADGSQNFYTGDAKQVVVRVGMETKLNAPLVADFGQINFDNMLCKIGAFRIKKTSNMIITPLSGVTITKITGRQQIAGSGKANCGNTSSVPAGFDWTYAEDNQVKSITNPISSQVTLTVDSYELRFSWIEVEYSGTPTQVAPVVFDNTFPLVAADKTVTLSCATAGATIEYNTVSADAEAWTAYPAGGIQITEPVMIYARAKKAGMADGNVNFATYTPIETGLSMAEFTFNQWDKLPATTAGKVYTTADAKPNGDNFEIAVSNDTFQVDNATLNVSKGTTDSKIFWSTTLGTTVNLRYYTNSVSTFSVLEGKQIVAALVNGGETLNYGADTRTLKNCSVTQLDNLNCWWLLNAVPEEGATAPQTTFSFTGGKNAGANYTGYIAHYYIFYKDASEAGVADMNADENAPVEYYNLQGVRVANPENGLYIRRQGSKTTKVIVK